MNFEERLTRPGGLASRLRHLRTDAGLSGQALATRLGWIQPKISKIETGKQFPTAEDIDSWVRATGAGQGVADDLRGLLDDLQATHREWREQVRTGQAPLQVSYDKLARQSTLIRNAEVTTVPGLLQTQGYARAQALQAVKLHGMPLDEVDAAVVARLERQKILYEEGRRFEFVITEAALRLRYCPRDAMLAQLDRLLAAAAGIPNVWFGIIPFGVELPIVPQNRFIMFDDIVAVETFVGETEHRGPQAATYAKAMDELMAEGWTGSRARELIVRAIEDLRGR